MMGNMQTPSPVAPGPVGTEQVVAEQVTVAQTEPAPVFKDEKKGGKGMLFGLILCLLLAAGGIGFGVWEMMDGNTAKADFENQIADLKKQNNELRDKLDGASRAEGDTADYIYVGEWGVKFKVPESLNAVQYMFKHRYVSGLKLEVESLCVSGVYGATGVSYEFMDSAYVCISQNFGAGAGVQNDEYMDAAFPEGEFYVTGPQAVVSVDEGDKKVEQESVQAIYDWLSNPEFRSSI